VVEVLPNLFKRIIRKSDRKSVDQPDTMPNTADKPAEPDLLSESLADNLVRLRGTLAINMDIVFREIYIAGQDDLRAFLIYFNEIIDRDVLDRDILHPLLFKCHPDAIRKHPPQELVKFIYKHSIAVGPAQEQTNISNIITELHAGKLVIIVDGCATALAIDITGGEKRSIEEPFAEKAVRSPREGFVEQLQTNLMMIRRKLRDPKLVIEKMILGQRSQTDTAILYISDIADPKILEEVKKRLQNIDIDSIGAASSIEQLIEDNPYSIFPQMRSSERPERIVAALLEGKIAIAVDGTSFILIIPARFVEFYTSQEDYYDRAHVATFVRLLRYAAFIISITLPSVYVALVSFHNQLIPFQLLAPIGLDRSEVPFSPIVEILLMEIVIEILREAGIHLPTPIGQTLGVVGGIILGQAAISSKIVSPLLLMVIGITVICTFVIPTYNFSMAVRLVRFPMVILTAMFGAFGLSIGWILLLVHLVKLESFGVPYLAPFAPIRFADLKDTFYRTFIWQMRQRPLSIPGADKQRAGDMRRRNKSE
jgi:hypothetical protein